MRFSFPKKIFVNGKWSQDKKRMLDASDATTIALHGVRKHHGMLSFAESFYVAAPGQLSMCQCFGKSLDTPMMTAPPPGLPSVSAGDSASPSTTIYSSFSLSPAGDMEDTPIISSSSLRDPWVCTLVPGCKLRCNHANRKRWKDLTTNGLIPL